MCIACVGCVVCLSVYNKGLTLLASLQVDERFVGSIAQEMNIQEEIMRKERELEDARRKLEKLRKAKYTETGA